MATSRKMDGAKNFYSLAKSNPEVLEKRRQRVEALDASVDRMKTSNPGRIPSWDDERILKMDKLALEHGKRCVMWDDAGAGFFLMLNWDWVHNRPAMPSPQDSLFAPGWWVNAKELLGSPLLDPATNEKDLAAWIDKHTMRVHHRLLKSVSSVRSGPKPGVYVLDSSDPYWAELQAFDS